MGVVGGEGLGDVARAQLVEGLAFPRSCWRRFSLSSMAPSRSARAPKAPPASISASWRGSPTRISLAPDSAVDSISRPMVRVPTMPASSTTSTSRGPRTRVPSSSSPRSRAKVTEGMPARDLELLGGPGAERGARDDVAGRFEDLTGHARGRSSCPRRPCRRRPRLPHPRWRGAAPSRPARPRDAGGRPGARST